MDKENIGLGIIGLAIVCCLLSGGFLGAERIIDFMHHVARIGGLMDAIFDLAAQEHIVSFVSSPSALDT